MVVRIGSPGAAETDRFDLSDAEVSWVKAGMLTGEDEPDRSPALEERVDYWRKFDRFGAGADDQPHFVGTQYSP